METHLELEKYGCWSLQMSPEKKKLRSKKVYPTVWTNSFGHMVRWCVIWTTINSNWSDTVHRIIPAQALIQRISPIWIKFDCMGHILCVCTYNTHVFNVNLNRYVYKHRFCSSTLCWTGYYSYCRTVSPTLFHTDQQCSFWKDMMMNVSGSGSQLQKSETLIKNRWIECSMAYVDLLLLLRGLTRSLGYIRYIHSEW